MTLFLIVQNIGMLQNVVTVIRVFCYVVEANVQVIVRMVN